MNSRRSPRQFLCKSRRFKLRKTFKWPRTNGRFPFTKKTPEISVVAKVEFPIGKKLFHLVVNPGMWPGARPWTWKNWYKLQET